ncbi:MAG: metalloregulator ArsR/SmtB family transcription factor [Candidatus Sumerlaeota bacterium]|nr:metalloregulator ArsR/SmtB family transcription factor [Candidatus Sumerlaeota bacterium]
MNEIIATNPIAIFRALSEELRLRVLNVLEVAEFSVQELTEALGVPQSTISRHLARLREADLVAARRQGTLVFYSKGPAQANGISRMIAESLQALPQAEGDRAAAQRILDARRHASQSYFDAMARRYSEIVEPGGSWRALAGALALGYDGKVVADVGAGEGELTERLAESAAHVYAVDQSPEMIKALKARLGKRRNVTIRRGDFEALPLKDASCDCVIASQTLHHCSRPRQALQEAWRILRAGGRLIILDLAAHEQEWTREKLADLWLGFDEAELTAWMKSAGFENIKTLTSPTSHDDLKVLTVTGIKP